MIFCSEALDKLQVFLYIVFRTSERKKNTYMTIGQRIAEAREKLGLSQAELGRRLCVGRSAVWNWENNQARPNFDNLIAIARECGVRVGDLLEAAS